MTEWTGELYGFYTNKQISRVFGAMINEVEHIGYQCEYHAYGEERSLLFYKNRNMLNHHLNVGYNTDLGGQGCFCIEAKNVNLHGMASLFEFESMSNFEPYDINLILDSIYYYILIVPDFVDESDFCAQIYHLMISVLKKCNS